MWRDNRESYRNYLRNFKEVSSCVESNNFISLCGTVLSPTAQILG